MERLKCYASVSYLSDISIRDRILENLSSRNIGTSYHAKGLPYTDHDLRNSDFVLLICHENSNVFFDYNIHTNLCSYTNKLGKGQYQEMMKALQLGKPVFVYKGLDEHGEILMTEVKKDLNHRITENDWTKDWGRVKSRTLGKEYCELLPFVNDYFNVGNKMTSSEKRRDKFLLLLKD